MRKIAARAKAGSRCACPRSPRPAGALTDGPPNRAQRLGVRQPSGALAGATAKTATGPALGKVGRAILCPPPLANRCVLVHHAGAHGVTRPTAPGAKTRPKAVWGGRTGQWAFGFVCGVGARRKSGGGPPHSKTLARWPVTTEPREASWANKQQCFIWQLSHW